MKKLTIEIDFESQSMNVSVNEETHLCDTKTYAAWRLCGVEGLSSLSVAGTILLH